MMQIFIRVLIAVLLKNMVIAQVLIGRMKFLALQVLRRNHNVNITGGTEKTKYMLSYNYTGEDGIMDKHGYQKNSIRAKINHELWKGVRF